MKIDGATDTTSLSALGIEAVCLLCEGHQGFSQSLWLRVGIRTRARSSH
jgi:hypothetical protein